MTDRAAMLSRAKELDDDLPLDTCPGCGQLIAGWERYSFHYPDNAAPRRRGREAPWPFVNGHGRYDVHCVWTLDYLLARRHRRRLIAASENS